MPRGVRWPGVMPTSMATTSRAFGTSSSTIAVVKRRHGRCAADDGDVLDTRGGVERRDVHDALAGVGDVDVMYAALGAAAREREVAGLEGTERVDQDGGLCREEGRDRVGPRRGRR